jgi:hypothetical protein
MPFQVNTSEKVESALLATPNGRLALASLDLRDRELNLARKWEKSESDRASRFNADVNAEEDWEEDRAALTADVHALFAHPTFRWLTRFLSWPEVKKLSKRFRTPNE